MRLTYRRKAWCKTVLSGRKAGVCHTLLSSENMCCQGNKIWHLIVCNALGTRLRLIGGCQSVIFPLFSGPGGFLCRGHHLPDGRHCAAESKTAEELFMEQTYLNLLCNYLLGKAVQAQLCSLSLLGDWSQLLFYCQHLLTTHLRGGCKALRLLNPTCLFHARFG